MSLKTRIERLESARSEGVIEILRELSDGTGELAIVRDGRVIARQALDPDGVRQWANRPHVTIARSYGRAAAR